MYLRLGQVYSCHSELCAAADPRNLPDHRCLEAALEC